jgi:hypothetical protein
MVIDIGQQVYRRNTVKPNQKQAAAEELRQTKPKQAFPANTFTGKGL